MIETIYILTVIAFKGQTGQVKAGVFETVLDWEIKWMFTIRMLEGLTVA